MKPIEDGSELNPEQIAALCDALFDSSFGIDERAQWLQALAAKGETANEIASFVKTLIARAVPFPKLTNSDAPTMDVCGTGGDKLGLFNISTAVMFIVAAAGMQVVKHGNRGITSKSGGADILEAAGVRIDLNPKDAATVLDQTGCVFLFAPKYHPTFREVAPVRQALASRGIVTIFNKLGPLLNPAMPTHQLAGVYQSSLVPLYADVFRALGRKRAWAVHGHLAAGGMDEMSTMGACDIAALEDDTIRHFSIDPRQFGLVSPHPSSLAGSDAASNAARLPILLSGNEPGPLEDMIAWNAAAALMAADYCTTPDDGLSLARELIRNGSAARKLAELCEASKSFDATA